MTFLSCLMKFSNSSSRFTDFVNSQQLVVSYLNRHKRDFYLSSVILVNAEEKLDHVDDDQHLAEQLKIDKLRNKSRLREDHRNILLNKVPYSEPIAEHHLTVRYHRKMFGKYGLESGVYPGISWPTKADLETRREYEKVAYPQTIQELVKSAEDEIKERELLIQKKHSWVVANMAKLQTWMKDLHEKINKREAEALAIKEKKEKLVEEVRRHFGFKIDPKDERFKEMLAVKEKEQKKKEKQRKMEEREKKAIAKLMSTNNTTTPQSVKTDDNSNP